MVVHHVVVMMMMVVAHTPNLPLIAQQRRSETGVCRPHLAPMTADGPSLADDEAALGAYAMSLADAFEQVAASWFIRLVEQRSPGVTAAADVLAELHDAAGETVAAMRTLLAADITAQRVGPLEIVRRAVIGVPTQVLRAVGTPVVARDDFSQSKFPDDVYGLTPASFGDIDPTLHEPGLVWGAAKAHVHLRRRRDAATE